MIKKNIRANFPIRSTEGIIKCFEDNEINEKDQLDESIIPP